MNAPTDEFLIGQIVQSLDQAHGAFGQLYAAHAVRLLPFIQTRVGADAADDVHQDVWLRVWDALPRQYHGGNFRAWLFEIARNLCCDWGRRQPANEQAFEDSQPLPSEWQRPAPGQTPPEQSWQEQTARALRACLQRLERDNPEAAALVHAITGGRPYVDVCQELNLKTERAHRLYHDARKQLRHCVEKAQP